MMKKARTSDAFQQPTISAMFGITPSSTKNVNSSKRKLGADTDSASKVIRKTDSQVKSVISKSVNDISKENQIPDASLTNDEIVLQTLSPESPEPETKMNDEDISSLSSPTSKEVSEKEEQSVDQNTMMNESESESENKTNGDNIINTSNNKELPNLSKFVGMTIRKHFDGHGWYLGEIDACNMVDIEGVVQCLWTVSYPDGDSEELDEEDVLKGINEFEKSVVDNNDDNNDDDEVVVVTNENENKEELVQEKDSTKVMVAAPLKSTSFSSKKKKKKGTKEEPWMLPDGWRLEERTNAVDAKVKAGETYQVWIAPDGHLYKSLHGAKKRHASDMEKPEGAAKVEKKNAKESASSSSSSSKPLSSFFGNSNASKKVTSEGKEGVAEDVPPQNQVSPSSSSSTTTTTTTEEKKVEDKEEWVQCDSCCKWRKLPLGKSPESLNEKWTCSLNDWDTSNNNCEAEQEVSNDEIDGIQKKNKNKSQVTSSTKKTNQSQPSKKASTKKPLTPEAAAKVSKYQGELDKITVDHEAMLVLDTQLRAQQLATSDINFEEGVLPTDIEAMKKGISWALEGMLKLEPATEPSCIENAMDVDEKAESTECPSSSVEDTAASSTETTQSTPTPPPSSSSSSSSQLEKLIACFIQGSPVPLPQLVKQMKDFFEHQASLDEKEAASMTTKSSEMEQDQKEKSKNIEGVEKPPISSAQLLHRASLLQKVTEEELSERIPLLAERKCYGITLRGQALLLLNDDKSSLTHARWEVINLDLVNSSAPQVKKSIESARKERRKLGSFIKIWHRLVDMLQKHQDPSKVEVEEAKLNKLELEEKARLIKQAQMEAKELETKRALERNKLEKEKKKLELQEKKEKEKAAQDLKNKEKEKEAALKAKLEKEIEEKKKKQSMKFMGFFKVTAPPSASSSSSSSSPSSSSTESSSSPSSSSSSSSSAASSTEPRKYAPSSTLSSASTKAFIDLPATKKTEPVPPNCSILNFGAPASSAPSGLSSTSSPTVTATSTGATTTAMISTEFYRRMMERLNNFDIEAHDEEIRLKPSLDDLSKKLVLNNKASSKKKQNNIQKRKKKPRWITAKVSMVTEVNNENESWGQASSFVELKDRHFKNKMVLLQFQEDERPPWWGTWSKLSTVINGRGPLNKDQNKLRHYGEVNAKDGYQFNYEVDSEAEWEEEEPGEDLDSNDKDEDNEEDGAEDFDYADGWLRRDDDLGSDAEEEGCAGYGGGTDDSPNPPSVEGPFLFNGSANSDSGTQQVNEEFPEHLKKYTAVPMPWIVSTSKTTQNEEGGQSVEQSNIGCFPIRVVDSLRDSLALYDVVPEKQKPSKSASTSSSSTSTTTSTTATKTIVESAPTPESTAAALAAAASVVASLTPETSSSSPPAKRVKADLKMVTSFDQLAFLAGLVHQSDGWNCDKIIATFLTTHSEHSKMATKRTVDSIAEKKGRNWCLKPEALVKFGIKTQAEVDAMVAAAAAAASLKTSTPKTPKTLKPLQATSQPNTSSVETPTPQPIVTASKTVPSPSKLSEKSESNKRSAVPTSTILDAFTKKMSPAKKLKTATKEDEVSSSSKTTTTTTAAAVTTITSPLKVTEESDSMAIHNAPDQSDGESGKDLENINENKNDEEQALQIEDVTNTPISETNQQPVDSGNEVNPLV